MGKRKLKPLLSEEGLLHLKSSFVPPSEESGLLTTVGGSEQPLVLASGSYGYGIPISSLKNFVGGDGGTEEESEKGVQMDPDVQTVREINGGVYSSDELKRDRSGAEKEINHAGLSVAQLVRSIGGAKDTPLRTCDLVKDTENDEEEEEDDEVMEVDPEQDEFYSSLGLPNPKEPKVKKKQVVDSESKDDKGEGAKKELNEGANESVEDVSEEIRDFYKGYTQYYYSKQSHPLSDERLEFGLPITPGEDQSSSSDQTIIQLARMAQLRARQAKAASDALEKAKREKALPSTSGSEVVEREEDIYDPLPMEVVLAQDIPARDKTLEEYWDYVREDPHDFNRWVYLIHYTESKDNVAWVRRVYGAFLPHFPYCFGYWKRYSDLEKKHNYHGRALTILERGLEFVPLSIDLWLTYMSLFKEIHALNLEVKDLVRNEYERGLETCGLDFRSDSFWEDYIKWETDGRRLRRVFKIYARLLQVPTKLYNRHWDNFQVLVRDHHPRDFLEKEEYEALRKKGCRKLGFKYKEEPEVELGEIRLTSKPEDKLMAWVKEKVTKKVTKIHDKTVVEAEKRWDFEDRIRRPYFHVKPLDKYQLRNWEDYLNYEIQQGQHDRIVLLFERCLIPCALYEAFWCKYARYLESYHKKNPDISSELSIHFLKNMENTEIGTEKETFEEEERVLAVKEVVDSILLQLDEEEAQENFEISKTVSHVINTVSLLEMSDSHPVIRTLITEKVRQSATSTKDVSEPSWMPFSSVPVTNISAEVTISSADFSSPPWTTTLDLSSISPEFFSFFPSEYESLLNSEGYLRATEALRRSFFTTPALPGALNGTPGKAGTQNNSSEDLAVQVEAIGFLEVPEFPPAKWAWQEGVRDVYKRAVIVHCPKKAGIRLQWAGFEEELGNSDGSLELVRRVILWFPSHLQARLLLLEMERRRGGPSSLSIVTSLFDKYLSEIKKKEEASLLALKYARFLHKECVKPEKALKVLRQAIKKDKSNPRLYSYVLDICYEKVPSERKAALAAFTLASTSKDLDPKDRLTFLKRKVLFLQEHGEIKKYREALVELSDAETEQRKIERKEEKQREAAGKQRSSNLTPFPVPSQGHDHPQTTGQGQRSPADGQRPVPIQFEPLSPPPEGGRAANDQPTSSAMGSKEDTENGAFKSVPPPEGLDMSAYGYSSKHPDYKLQEYMAQKEYEKLESHGYPEELKDKEGEGVKKKRKEEEEKLYIIQPKSATMYLSIPSRQDNANGEDNLPGNVTKGPPIIELEAPMRLSSIAVPSSSPCINVPEWFTKEGGELCLSESRAGFSVLRFWPHFLNDEGANKVFKAVRRSVKWHQKQKVVKGSWRFLPRLVSWLGPCAYTDRGLELNKNEDWPPEILDMLHRINQITGHEFNSCFLNLYRTGHDWMPWHADIHPAYGSNPPIASISLGSQRLFEMKKRGPKENFLRFPLFPGCLLIMEGATQSDWSHTVPRDPKVDGERISLVFRIMHAIEPLDKDKDRKDLSDQLKDKEKEEKDPLSPSANAKKPRDEESSPKKENKDSDRKRDKSEEPPSKRGKREEESQSRSSTKITFYDRRK